MYRSTSAAEFLSGLDERPATLDEIARRLGVSLRSVRRIHAWARVGAADKFIEEPGHRGKFATFRLAHGVKAPTAQERSHVGVVTPSQLAWVDARLENCPSDTERAFRSAFGGANIGHDALIQLIYRRRAALGVRTCKRPASEKHLDRIPVEALKPLPRTPADDARDAMFAACRRRMAKERERLASLRRERLRKSETWRIA